MKIKLIFYVIIPIIYGLFVVISIFASFFLTLLLSDFLCNSFLSNTNECNIGSSAGTDFSIFLFFLYFVFPVCVLFIIIWVFVIKFINNKYKKYAKKEEDL